jgi:rRNA maturation endonuclease Nob1
MGLLDLLHELVQGPGVPGPSRDPRFRCLQCGTGHDREHQTCPECGGSFVVPDTDEEGSGDEDPPWL